MTTIVLDDRETDALITLLVEFVVGQEIPAGENAYDMLDEILAAGGQFEAEISALPEEQVTMLEQMAGKTVAEMVAENSERHNLADKILTAARS
jgi:hypothetical protein